jgi:hypothetical protein
MNTSQDNNMPCSTIALDGTTTLNGTKEYFHKNAEQSTLQGLSKANLWVWEDMKEGNDISTHGFSKKDHKSLLTITREAQENEVKVTQSSIEAVKARTAAAQWVADPSTFLALSSIEQRSMEDSKGINGIYALGSFHKAIGRPFSSTRGQLKAWHKVDHSSELLSETCTMNLATSPPFVGCAGLTKLSTIG